MRQIQFRMGNRIGQHRKERFFLMGADKIHRPLVNQILRISLMPLVPIFRNLHPLLILPQMIGIIGVRLTLTIITKKLIISHFVGCRFRSWHSQTPFAKQTGAIACILHQTSNRIGVFPHRLLPLWSDLLVSTNLRMSGVQTGHNGATRGGTHRATGIMLHELHPLLRHAVEVWCLDIRLSITTQITISHVVAQDKDHIHRSLLLRPDRGTQAHQSGSKQVFLLHIYYYFTVSAKLQEVCENDNDWQSLLDTSPFITHLFPQHCTCFRKTYVSSRCKK